MSEPPESARSALGRTRNVRRKEILQMVIQFTVDGTPPKKDGANSMWRKRTELPKLKALRTAASREMRETSLPQRAVKLIVNIYADAKLGDLDNFITGICDALQPAHSNTPIDENDWRDVPVEARPDRPIVFRDDQIISRIFAERTQPTDNRTYYDVMISWE